MMFEVIRFKLGARRNSDGDLMGKDGTAARWIICPDCFGFSAAIFCGVMYVVIGSWLLLPFAVAGAIVLLGSLGE